MPGINRPDLVVPAEQVQQGDAHRHEARQPAAACCPVVADPAPRNNLAFRNLLRANMVKLATGQQMATFLKNKGVTLTKLTNAQIRDGNNGADLGGAHRRRSETRCSRTRRCGSTSCARPSSTRAS